MMNNENPALFELLCRRVIGNAIVILLSIVTYQLLASSNYRYTNTTITSASQSQKLVKATRTRLCSFYDGISTTKKQRNRKGYRETP
jgi:hypothetical protein